MTSSFINPANVLTFQPNENGISIEKHAATAGGGTEITVQGTSRSSVTGGKAQRAVQKYAKETLRMVSPFISLQRGKLRCVSHDQNTPQWTNTFVVEEYPV